jgi:hypothetical protein
MQPVKNRLRRSGILARKAQGAWHKDSGDGKGPSPVAAEKLRFWVAQSLQRCVNSSCFLNALRRFRQKRKNSSQALKRLHKAKT